MPAKPPEVVSFNDQGLRVTGSTPHGPERTSRTVRNIVVKCDMRNYTLMKG
jgi:hypothetical protein